MVTGLRSVIVDLGIETERVTELETWPLIQVTDTIYIMQYDENEPDRFIRFLTKKIMATPGVWS